MPACGLTSFAAGVLVVGVLGADGVSGQNYPNKPIRIVSSGSGGAGNFTARLLTPGLSSNLGHQVIVDIRPGYLAGEIVSKAPADGYTLLIAGGSFMFGPLLEKTPYDPVRDFSPITLAVGSPNVLVVYPPLPVNSVKELIALAKAKPGELNYGSSGTGSSGHLATELFKAMAEVNIVHVPYKDNPPALIDLIGGQLQLMFPSAGAVAPHIKSSRLRALAITSAEPSALFPGLPTVAASGLPGYQSVSMTGMFAPAKTPATLINRLNQEIVRVLNQADVKERFFSAGVETVGSSPEQFADKMKSEIARLGKVIRDAGIRAE